MKYSTKVFRFRIIDKLDGVHGSSFLRSDAADTATGQIPLTQVLTHTTIMLSGTETG